MSEEEKQDIASLIRYEPLTDQEFADMERDEYLKLVEHLKQLKEYQLEYILEEKKIKVAGQAISVFLATFMVYFFAWMIGEISGKFHVHAEEWLLNMFGTVFSGALGVVGIAYLSRSKKKR